jgi:Ca-activated chloride channel homolog
MRCRSAAARAEGWGVARTLPDYDELVIRLTPGRGDAYNVEIASALGARGHGQFVAPSQLDIERFRRTMDPRYRRVRGRSRYLEAATQFGAGLFEGLLGAPSVREVYTVARRDASAAGRGLRVTLSLRAAPELACIPWEFLYDRPRFLAQHVHSPVVRFVDLEDPPPPLRVQAPLRVLGMVSRPKDDALASLDVEEEQAALERRLRPLIDTGQVTLRWLPAATLRALQKEVDHGEDFHVFHYVGHGEHDAESGHSSLILEHDDGRPHPVGGQQLGALLCDRGSLRLAVLNTCEAAQTAPQDPLAGVSTSLMEYDVPAVVAMQFAITDAGALTFADEFYGAVAAGYTVDAAVTQARRALAADSDVEWGTPVLFMRIADGRLFDLQSATTPQIPETARVPSNPHGDRRPAALLAMVRRRRPPAGARSGRRSRRGGLRIAIAVVLVAAAFAAVLMLVPDRPGPSSLADVIRPGPADIIVKFNYSGERETKDLLAPLIAAYNRERRKLDDRAIFVKGEQTASGEAATGIASRQITPTAWSPTDEFWARQMNYQAHRSWAPAHSPVLMQTTTVIAMWEPMAKALGHPNRRIGFEQILRLARSPDGWANEGRPDFGAFKFVHTNPAFSSTGLAATVAEYQFATGKRDLQVADVHNPTARRKVRTIERSIVHYGDTTVHIIDQLAKHGPGYASAVVLGEATLMRFNRTRAGRGERLVAIYPKEGTFFREHPFIVLDAPWVTPEHKRAARDLGRYLAAKITPQLAAKHDYRPAQPQADLPSDRWRALGNDVSLQTERLTMPSPPVLNAIQHAWREDRKPANVLIVLDTSGSMATGRRLQSAKQGLNMFLKEIAPQDRVGLITFANIPRTRVPLQSFKTARKDLRTTIRGLRATGATATYDATAHAFDSLAARGGANDINAVVLLTDGTDTRSTRSYRELLDNLREYGRASNPPRLYTIAYGPDAEATRKKLTRLADATGGHSYVGTEKNIVGVYRDISSFF